MRPGGKLPKIRKIKIESEYHTIFTLGSHPHFNIDLSQQSLVKNRRDVVTQP